MTTSSFTPASTTLNCIMDIRVFEENIGTLQEVACDGCKRHPALTSSDDRVFMVIGLHRTSIHLCKTCARSLTALLVTATKPTEPIKPGVGVRTTKEGLVIWHGDPV